MLQTDRLGLAISLLERAGKGMPQDDIFANLAIAYKQSGQHNKCVAMFKEAIKHDPSAKVLADYAALFVNVGTPQEAIKHSQKALNKDPNCHMAHWNMGLGKLELGMWDTGWDHFEHSLFTNPPMRIDRHIADKPYWDGTPGKKLAIYGEQGLGDEIMFASILPDVMRDNTVIFECHERLETLFKRSFDIPIYGTREKHFQQISWPNDHEIDAQVSLGSLGQYYRRSREAFPGTPYLKAESAPRGDKFRVGISWTGGMKPGRIRVREIPLTMWYPILNNSCEFISLQYTECHDEIDAVNRLGGHDIIEMDDIVKAHDYYETAKLVKSCDLIISCATSLYHLAGALGVRTWLMAPNKPAWREGFSGPIPWYRSVRVYRQPGGGQDMWRPVVERVGYDLSELLHEKRQMAA
jgi:hypothetical protein